MGEPGDHGGHSHYLQRDLRPCEVLMHAPFKAKALCLAYSVEFFLETLPALARSTAAYWQECLDAAAKRAVGERGTLDYWTQAFGDDEKSGES